MTTAECAGEASFCGLVGRHPLMLALRDEIRRAAGLDAPVVVCGPTGAGKELVARALHASGPNGVGPFCPVNVAALPESLLESEMFGSARGAFTGAVADRRGLAETAHGGSLFLDEAGDLPLHVQAKLLRVLDSGEVRRLGATQARCACFRLIAAVQEEPCVLLRDRRWRQDFFYRVTGVLLRVPALQEHSRDIPLLAHAFLKARRLPDLEAEGLAVLARHAWPGNVRELQQTLLRAAFHGADGLITAHAIRAALEDGGNGHSAHGARSLDAARRRHVREVVDACAGDTGAAAVQLGISRSQVYRILSAERSSTS